MPNAIAHGIDAVFIKEAHKPQRARPRNAAGHKIGVAHEDLHGGARHVHRRIGINTANPHPEIAAGGICRIRLRIEGKFALPHLKRNI